MLAGSVLVMKRNVRTKEKTVRKQRPALKVVMLLLQCGGARKGQGKNLQAGRKNHPYMAIWPIATRSRLSGLNMGSHCTYVWDSGFRRSRGMDQASSDLPTAYNFRKVFLAHDAVKV